MGKLSMTSTEQQQLIITDDIITIVQTPTISAGAIYAGGDAVGGLLTFANATRIAGGTGTVLDVKLIDYDKEAAPLELVLFDRTFGATADNAPFDPTDADLANWAGTIFITTGDYSSFVDNGGATGRNINLNYTLLGTSLFGQLRLPLLVTPTYTAVGDLTIKIVCRRN